MPEHKHGELSLKIYIWSLTDEHLALPGSKMWQIKDMYTHFNTAQIPKFTT